jgi:hypothetical protein
MKRRPSVFLIIGILTAVCIISGGYIWGFFASDFVYEKVTSKKNVNSFVTWNEIRKINGFFNGGIELVSLHVKKGQFELKADSADLVVYPWKVRGVIEALRIEDVHNTGKLLISKFYSQANGLVWRFKEVVPEIASYGDAAELRLEGSELKWKKWKSRWKPDFEGDFRTFSLESEHFEIHKVGTVQEFHAYLDFPRLSLVDEENETGNRTRKYTFSVDATQWKHANEGAVYQGEGERLSLEALFAHQKAFSVTSAMNYFKKLFSQRINGLKTAGKEFKDHLESTKVNWKALNASGSRFQFHSENGELSLLERNPFELMLTSKKLNWNFDLLWDQYKTVSNQLVFKTKLAIDKQGMKQYLKYVFYPKRKPEKQADESYRLEKLYNQLVQLFNAVQTSGRLDVENLTVGGKGIDEWFQISNVRQEYQTQKDKDGINVHFNHESILEMDEKLKMVFPDLGSLDNSSFSLRSRLRHLTLIPLHFTSSRTRLSKTVMNQLVSNQPDAEIEFYHIQDEDKLLELKGYSRLDDRKVFIPKKQQTSDLSTWLQSFWYNGSHKYLVRIRDKKRFQDVFGSLIVFEPVKKAVQKITPMIKSRNNKLYLDLSRRNGKTKINYKSSRYFEKAFIKP